MHIAP
jgi:hypothetical protein